MLENHGRFHGKTALVTGAGSGIGRSVAVRLAEEGGDVLVTDLNEKNVEETQDMVRNTGRTAIARQCDIGQVSEIFKLVEYVFKKVETVDILVNCAGIGETSMSYDEIGPELWDRIYAVNVRGPFFLSQKIAEVMIEKDIKGRIINISSTEGKTNRAGSVAYGSSKSALIGLTQGLANQLAPTDITVNAVCPGLIDTPIWHRADKSMELPKGSVVKMVVDTAIESRQLKIMRVGQPEDIAGVVAFLASEDAEYMTGQAINVCGGIEFG